MSFLVFLGYFIASMLTWNLISLTISYFLERRMKNRLIAEFKKAVAEGRIQTVSIDELAKDQQWH